MNKNLNNNNYTTKKKTRRGQKKKNSVFKVVAIGTNAAGLKQKMHRLNLIISTFKPSCIFIQETKLYRKGQITIEGYQIFEHVRKNSKGGGLLLAVDVAFDPVQIFEGDEMTSNC